MKDNWEKSRERFVAWWQGGAVDRVLLQVISPIPGAERPAPPRDLDEFWLSVDYRLRATEQLFSATHFGGDAFPYVQTPIGPGTFSLYLGAKAELMPETVWYHPCIEDITTAAAPSFDPANKYWLFSQELAKQAVERFGGRALVAVPDLIEGLDTISSLIGNEELLLALIDSPPDVHRFQRALTPLYFEYYDRLFEIIKDEHGGCCFSAFDTYAPGRMTKLQCDFSAMIGPEMFDEFAAPYLAEMCENLDFSVYHLDGPHAVQHLDTLLSIDKLSAIQWTPGAGQPLPCDETYIPMFKKIRSKGKSVMLRGGSAEQAEHIVREMGPEGLDILIWADSPATADAIVESSYKW